MKVALAQTHILWENKQENEKQALKYIEQAADLGAQAVFFPEMSLTGFSMNTKETAEKNIAVLHNFSDMAIRYHMAIGIGWTKQGERLAENHYSIIDGEGNLISDYTKIHPFSYADENKFFISGEKITYFELGEYCWSNFICYDLRFPELFQIASEKAEVIIVPANWPKRRNEHWRCLLRARAIENQCYILAVNCVGQINGIEYSGNSCGISPNGEMLSELEGKTGIIMVDLWENVKELQKGFPVKQDRKWDFYIAEYRRRK